MITVNFKSTQIGCNTITSLCMKSKRRVFSQLEDQTIREYVFEHGENWEEVAKKLPGRTAKQCHDRYDNYLRDGLKSEPWSPEEDETLVKMFKEIGPKWVKMMKNLPGRSGNSIKNRWHKHLIKNEKYYLSQQKNDFIQKITASSANVEQNKLANKIQKTGPFLIEPIISNNNTNEKEENKQKPNVIMTKKIPINNSVPSNQEKKVNQYLPLPPVNFDLFDVLDITDKFMEEIFDDLTEKPGIGSYYDKFFSYI